MQELYLRAQNYLALKQREKSTKDMISKIQKELKDSFAQFPVTEKGKNKEVVLGLPEGGKTIILQINTATKVTEKAEAISILRQKLGKEAEALIETQEMIKPGALEQLVLSGKLSAQDLRDMTESKDTERFTVKQE